MPLIARRATGLHGGRKRQLGAWWDENPPGGEADSPWVRRRSAAEAPQSESHPYRYSRIASRDSSWDPPIAAARRPGPAAATPGAFPRPSSTRTKPGRHPHRSGPRV